MSLRSAATDLMQNRSPDPLRWMARGGLWLASLPYAAAVVARNAMFDRGGKSVGHLLRPVVCVGNITTGGTGKTPVVRWLAAQLIERGHRPAILLRGYRATTGSAGDEADLLCRHLRHDHWATPVQADPDRLAGGQAVLARHPQTSVFLLDDGFQHRRLHRDLDIVLISATNPFGFDHLLPRGLLREPLSSLRRAGVIVITRADQVEASTLSSIEQTLTHHARGADVLRCSHRLTMLRDSTDDTPLPLSDLQGKRVFLFAGIGDPSALPRQLAQRGAIITGTRFDDDHHAYTPTDLHTIDDAADRAEAQLLVTTEKDWSRLLPLRPAFRRRLLRLDMQVEFDRDDGQRLLERIEATIARTTTAPASR